MSIGDFPECSSQAMLVWCNVSREIGHSGICADSEESLEKTYTCIVSKAINLKYTCQFQDSQLCLFVRIHACIRLRLYRHSAEMYMHQCNVSNHNNNNNNNNNDSNNTMCCLPRRSFCSYARKPWGTNQGAENIYIYIYIYIVYLSPLLSPAFGGCNGAAMVTQSAPPGDLLTLTFREIPYGPGNFTPRNHLSITCMFLVYTPWLGHI